MNLDDFRRLADRARGDGSPMIDAAPAVLARLTRRDGGRERLRIGWAVAVLSASAAAACVLGALGYQAMQSLDQAGFLNPLDLWVNL
ncbi:MAG: hypothetical protein PHU85_01150 [Phycisphaerae bacterium]|nr:hypothetical protein [Phycisphaerae bacterium]